MAETTDQPIIPGQTTAQNEAVETVLSRLAEGEIFVPAYQRDSDEWEDEKKSLFIESILNRLTVPAFYLAPSEADPNKFDVVDGQQRLTTLDAFYRRGYRLQSEDACPYYGTSIHYADRSYEELVDDWKRSFRRYNLTLVQLPQNMPLDLLDLRLEIFRRINEGGTPLSGQDIRLSYYSESKAVRFIQLVGIYDVDRTGAGRMLKNARGEFTWPWESDSSTAQLWQKWWNNTRTAIGQTASEMFLWYMVANLRADIDRILINKKHLTKNLTLSFRNSTEEVLDIACAELRFEEKNASEPRLLPNVEALQKEYFPQFQTWWAAMRQRCTAQVQVGRHRAVAMLIPGLAARFKSPAEVTDNQWGWIGKFVSRSRGTASELGVEFPESKGRWSGNRGQRAQIEAYFDIAAKIAGK